MKRIALSALVASALFSTSSWADDLIQVYNMSLKSDPQLLAQAASKLAVGEQTKQAQALFLPQVQLKANESKVWQDTAAQRFGGNLQYNDHGYTLSLDQPIYHRENFVQKKQAKIAVEGADASYTAAEQDLIVRVAKSYFDVLGSEDDLTFAKAERDAISKQLEQTQQRFDVGLATITDVTEAKAAYDLAHASVIAAENALANSREVLRETTGKYLDTLSTLKPNSPLISPDPTNIKKWTEVALKQNPTLKVASTQVANARENIQLQRSGHYPTVDLVGQKSYTSDSDNLFSGGGTKTHQEVVGIEFNLPIYSGGAVTSRTRQAGYQLDQAMQQQEKARRSVIRQTREAYNSVMSGISQVKALKQAVVSNEKALESTKAGYDVGTRTTVDVLNSRRELFSARRDYARARYNYIVNTLKLKQAAGIVSPDDLVQINKWLNGS